MRYGCRVDMLSGFSRERDYTRYWIVPKDAPYCQGRLSSRICLGKSTPTPFNRLFRQTAALSLLRLHVAPRGSTGILTGSAIGIAIRLSLRTRLTLIRLALIRNLRFHTLQSASRHAFDAEWNAPLPTINCSRASAGHLCPIIIHAGLLD